ncbi:MAG: FAD-dependent thymidylate synthase [Steroidobacteraceae bacterium]
MDPFFRVEVLARTEHPQTVCWWAMHTDYSEEFVFNEEPPIETEAGRIVVRHLLAGNRGHYGPLEHPAITFNVGWFPHTVMQQARTHRVGVSFDVQSGRYTSLRILQVARRERQVEEVFYIRPVGKYKDRNGTHYEYPPEARRIDIARCQDAAAHYYDQIRGGLSEEHARELIPYAIRQHFVVSFNLRSLMHFLDLRSKADAELEITQLCDLIWPHFQSWAPQIADWYAHNRLHKARLAP